jgi:hypothetical protein
VAGCALLLEQRRTIGRLGKGQRHLRAAICATSNALQDPSPIAHFARSFVIHITVGVHRL